MLPLLYLRWGLAAPLWDPTWIVAAAAAGCAPPAPPLLDVLDSFQAKKMFYAFYKYINNNNNNRRLVTLTSILETKILKIIQILKNTMRRLYLFWDFFNMNIFLQYLNQHTKALGQPSAPAPAPRVQF